MLGSVMGTHPNGDGCRWQIRKRKHEVSPRLYLVPPAAKIGRGESDDFSPKDLSRFIHELNINMA